MGAVAHTPQQQRVGVQGSARWRHVAGWEEHRRTRRHRSAAFVLPRPGCASGAGGTAAAKAGNLHGPLRSAPCVQERGCCWPSWLPVGSACMCMHAIMHVYHVCARAVHLSYPAAPHMPCHGCGASPCLPPMYVVLGQEASMVAGARGPSPGCVQVPVPHQGGGGCCLRSPAALARRWEEW